MNGGGQLKLCCRTRDDGSIALVRLTLMQSPAFARRMSGSRGTPAFSLPLLSRSSLRTYMIPINEPIQFARAPRSLKINSPWGGFEPGTGEMFAKAFCAVTAVTLKVRRCDAGKLAGQVAYVTFVLGAMGLFGKAASLCAGAVGSYERKMPHN